MCTYQNKITSHSPSVTVSAKGAAWITNFASLALFHKINISSDRFWKHFPIISRGGGIYGSIHYFQGYLFINSTYSLFFLQWIQESVYGFPPFHFTLTTTPWGRSVWEGVAYHDHGSLGIRTLTLNVSLIVQLLHDHNSESSPGVIFIHYSNRNNIAEILHQMALNSTAGGGDQIRELACFLRWVFPDHYIFTPSAATWPGRVHIKCLYISHVEQQWL